MENAFNFLEALTEINDVVSGFNSLPNDKISDLSKFKAYADDNSNVDKLLPFVFGRLENIVGRGENVGY